MPLCFPPLASRLSPCLSLSLSLGPNPDCFMMVYFFSLFLCDCVRTHLGGVYIFTVFYASRYSSCFMFHVSHASHAFLICKSPTDKRKSVESVRGEKGFRKSRKGDRERERHFVSRKM
ncbi:hypothetical protein AUEXF2481DRAFT_534504 [Aureobasidium subglaciale EXF-2481]|uniref:Uncharacterized protein n=1 Tax=Aureobasidium subglaciale (strain EXF-2481) TaxID=1043005 RepID=A0A074Y943_AURSE|nr:uncharacterized protein AUEXF2481DRAFT_534504 [Aureobasidium subglaciale EXF-2481]KEQ90692.1 hypothetical protein AUEXF2481DRAFT_534504 [Aureobasidium subglaciale EXF-2481]